MVEQCRVGMPGICAVSGASYIRPALCGLPGVGVRVSPDAIIPAAEQGGRQALPAVVDEVTYLGLGGARCCQQVLPCVRHRLGRMKAAQAAIRGRLKDLHTPPDLNIFTGLCLCHGCCGLLRLRGLGHLFPACMAPEGRRVRHARPPGHCL